MLINTIMYVAVLISIISYVIELENLLNNNISLPVSLFYPIPIPLLLASKRWSSTFCSGSIQYVAWDVVKNWLFSGSYNGSVFGGGAGHRVRADRVQQQGDQPSLQPFHLAAVQHSRRMQDGRLGHGQPQGRDAKVYEQNQMVMREPPLSVADRGGWLDQNLILTHKSPLHAKFQIIWSIGDWVTDTPLSENPDC